MPKVPDLKPKRRTHFKSLAREIGCDEDRDRFEARLKIIAKAPPLKKPSKSSKENKRIWAKLGEPPKPSARRARPKQ